MLEGCVVDGAVVDAALVGGAVDGEVVGATVVGVVSLDGGAAVDAVATVVGGVTSPPSSSNANTTISTTAMAMTVQMTMTAVRCQPSQLESRSESRGGRGGSPPLPPAYARVGSPDSDGYATGRSSGGMRFRSLRTRSRQTGRVRLAPVRIVWLVLPLAAGPAASHALAGWSEPPRVLAVGFLWIAWGGCLVALLAPRPVGLTVARIVAPAFVALALVAAICDDASTLTALGGVVATVAAAALVADPAVALASANGSAYGDERRHPLCTPPALYLGPVPLARALVAAGAVTGPLLLAAGDIFWGVIAIVVGAPLAMLATRSLQSLTRRWLVLVPAGVVVVDSMTLADPLLVVRRQLRALRPIASTAPLASDAVDLRLGATLGTVEVVLDGEIDVVLVGRRGRADETVRPGSLVVAVATRRSLLAAAAARRRSGQAAMPPPSSAAPS